jgi:Ca-activated chloride channel homolog
MNARTRTFSLVIMMLAALISACAPAATAAPVAYATQQVVSTRAAASAPPAATQPPASGRVLYPTSPAMPTMAPAATHAPAPITGPGYAPRPMPQDNTFKDPGVNPYIDSRTDHLSTFAIDVDTASYTVARRYINDGSLPPIEAVRVEEFVNYFDPGYNPPASASFAIYADGARSPFSEDGTTLLRMGIQGYKVPDDQRKPVSLTFVIDISGSMNMENRLGLVKRSLHILVDRLHRNDLVSIVVFGSTARVVMEPTWGSNRDQIMWAIDSLQTEGSTNTDAGLRLGYEMAMRAFRPDASNKVILCSDGVANTGNTDPDAMLNFVNGYIKEGVFLNTVGFGMGNFNDALLERLADKGNGSYAYIDTLEEARSQFIEKLVSNLQTIALDAKVQVDFNPDVVAFYRLIGYENRAVADQDFRNDTVDAGEIGAGHHVVAIYAVQFRERAEGRIATVQLRWLDPQTRQPGEINGNLNTWDVSKDISQTDPHYQLAVAVAEFGEALRGSPWVGWDTLRQVVSLAASVRNSLPEDPDVIEFYNLAQRASQMWRPGINQ